MIAAIIIIAALFLIVCGLGALTMVHACATIARLEEEHYIDYVKGNEHGR